MNDTELEKIIVDIYGNVVDIFDGNSILQNEATLTLRLGSKLLQEHYDITAEFKPDSSNDTEKTDLVIWDAGDELNIACAIEVKYKIHSALDSHCVDTTDCESDPMELVQDDINKIHDLFEEDIDVYQGCVVYVTDDEEYYNNAIKNLKKYDYRFINSRRIYSRDVAGNKISLHISVFTIKNK